MNDLRAELAATLDEAEWDWLAPHARRDVVILVASGLDLVEVGVAIATDDATCIQRWIDEALIQKPSPSHLSEWNRNQSKRFQALIVQPYVLVQEASVNTIA
ncbi:DUF2288 family protein [Phormidium sp. CLA17]|uniref:DUF2288 domain-containing protein n=1 Tax=Leptolyngbya sp. Cla-17 TaxID=2803751 RepID=UPI001491FCD7|nr:DUF2288 domain-containing protein [Leptolyngbya sp. Cla-17]MBM0741547.1 DUF2288 family protein [Leptolyngbya sp. Cla-17]